MLGEVAVLSAVAFEPDIDPVALSVCGAGFGMAAALSEAKESLVIELFCAVSFFEQLIMNNTVAANITFFIMILFGIYQSYNSSRAPLYDLNHIKKIVCLLN